MYVYNVQNQIKKKLRNLIKIKVYSVIKSEFVLIITSAKSYAFFMYWCVVWIPLHKLIKITKL